MPPEFSIAVLIPTYFSRCGRKAQLRAEMLLLERSGLVYGRQAAPTLRLASTSALHVNARVRLTYTSPTARPNARQPRPPPPSSQSRSLFSSQSLATLMLCSFLLFLCMLLVRTP